MGKAGQKTGKKWPFQSVCVSICPSRIRRDPGQARAVSQGAGGTDTRDSVAHTTVTLDAGSAITAPDSFASWRERR